MLLSNVVLSSAWGYNAFTGKSFSSNGAVTLLNLVGDAAQSQRNQYSIRSVLVQSCGGIFNGDHPCGQGNLIPLEAVVTFAVDAFVVVLDPVRDIVKGMQGLQDPDAGTGMLFHDGPFVGVQLSGLVQYRLWDSQLAHIVHQRRVFQADRVDLAAQVGGKMPVENHGEVLDRQTMAVQVGVAGVDHADQDLRDVDASRPGCVHQVVEQREYDGDKDAAKEQDEGQEQVGVGEDANVEIAQQKEDDQHEGKRYPSLIPLAAGRENIMSGANKSDQAIDIRHHDRRAYDNEKMDDGCHVSIPKYTQNL